MIDNCENLFYTYLDECKKNFLTDCMKENGDTFEEYSITSFTFNKKSYQEVFEKEWTKLRSKYNMDSEKAMHFVEYKKLIKAEERGPQNKEYTKFEVDGEFSEDKLKEFFKDLRKLLLKSEFFIVHTDFYWNKQSFLAKRPKYNKVQLTNPSRNVADSLLNAVPYVAMRKHLDSLMISLLKNESDGNYYLDEMLPRKINTKLRFDADGKQFDARTDLKRAYNHTITVGSDNVNEKISSEILDEIRFIRKDEVGSAFTPNHCGLEVVDMFCSMLAGETRFKEYQNIDAFSEEFEYKAGDFINLKFSDGEVIEFESIIKDKIRYETINYLKY